MEINLFGEKNKKVYTKSPLPFQGNKRNFIKDFVNILKSSGKNINDYVVVDLFGGSGLLSHTIKRHFPNSRVIYNDRDNYKERLDHIEETEELRGKLYEKVKDLGIKTKIPEELAEELIQICKNHKYKYSRIDILTVSGFLLFSGQFASCLEDIKLHSCYNRIPKNSLSSVKGYLDGLEVVRRDYKDNIRIFDKEERVLFLFDPPYLNTDNAKYKILDSRTLKDYLDIVKYLEKRNFIFFTSEKSSTIELIERMNNYIKYPIKYTKRERMNSPNKGALYKDIMLYNI